MPNLVKDLSFEFAKSIVIFARFLSDNNKHIFPISSQLLRSGTSIGANIEEAMAAQSRKDFLAKIYIAFKEARECNYWLRLIQVTLICDHEKLLTLLLQSEELISILSSITKTTKTSLHKLNATK